MIFSIHSPARRRRNQTMFSIGFLFGLLSEVGTARCAVRAAFSGASTGRDRLMGQRVPPAARGRGRRSAASLPMCVRTVEGDSDGFKVPMLDVGSWKLDVGSWTLEVGRWMLDVLPGALRKPSYFAPYRGSALLLAVVLVV